jgi:hypothetical protein
VNFSIGTFVHTPFRPDGVLFKLERDKRHSRWSLLTVLVFDWWHLGLD